MKAVFNGKTVAETDKENLIFIEGSWYFPPDSINSEFFAKSGNTYTCTWKGSCDYYDVTVDGETAKDGAFAYGQPPSSAVDKVKKDFSGYYAFWNGVEVSE